MVRLWVALGILSVVAGFALGAGQAQAKRKGLSEAARSFLLRSVCDLPDRKYGPRAIAEAKVVLEDAKGLKYAAGHCRWCSPSSYLNEQFRGALSAMAVTSGRSKPQRKPSPSLTDLFRRVVGFSPGKKRHSRIPFKTHPAAVRWFVKLLPAPQTSMCGATAQAVYDSGLREVARKTADALIFSLETFERVSLKELDTALTSDDAHHDYLSRCRAFARRGRRYTDDVAADICLWWLRRAAVGDRMIVGRAVSQVLKTYDPLWWKAHAARLPKKLRR